MSSAEIFTQSAKRYLATPGTKLYGYLSYKQESECVAFMNQHLHHQQNWYFGHPIFHRWYKHTFPGDIKFSTMLCF